MKLWLFVAAMLFSCTVGAQQGGLTYRNSDPFLFCTHGQINPDKCWWPIEPYTGGAAWINSPWCEPVDPYGKPWTADDTASMEQYQTVCPQGIRPGGWDSKGGSAEMVPSYH